VVQSDGIFTAALDPSLDHNLRQEGLARELVNRIQRLRKDSGLEITDRIALGVFGGEGVRAAAEAFRDFIIGETLAREYRIGEVGDGGEFGAIREVELDGHEARIALSRLEE
jgi:isoleucyl-tRNA synthetase